MILDRPTASGTQRGWFIVGFATVIEQMMLFCCQEQVGFQSESSRFGFLKVFHSIGLRTN